jgi:hypothetical protein
MRTRRNREQLMMTPLLLHRLLQYHRERRRSVRHSRNECVCLRLRLRALFALQQSDFIVIVAVNSVHAMQCIID